MNAQTGKRPIIHWVDLVRVVAIYLVVMIHVSGQITNQWSQIPNGHWMLGNIYGSIARISVPLFFMISGYLLLPRSESLKDFYTKRMVKIVIPFIAWSLIYLGWFCGNYGSVCTPNYVQNLLLVQGTYYHLWFLYTLISIYLILPILRLIIRPDMDKRLLWYLIVLWLIFQPLMSIAGTAWNFRINISAPLATGFVCYFVLGYLLGEITLSHSRIILALIIWISGALATVLGTFYFSIGSTQYNGFFYDFLSLNVILASGAAFVLLRQIGEAKILTSPRIHSIMRSLATATFGIYLIHILVIEILNNRIPFLHLNSFMGSPIWSVPLVTTVVFTLSFLIVLGLQKIPDIRRIVP